MDSDFLRIVNFSPSAFNACFEENILNLKADINSNMSIFDKADFVVFSLNFISGNGNGFLNSNTDFLNAEKKQFELLVDFLVTILPNTSFILTTRERCLNCRRSVSVKYVINKRQRERISECECVRFRKKQKIFTTQKFSFCVVDVESTDDIADKSQNSALKYCDFVFFSAAIPSRIGSKNKLQRLLSSISEVNKNVVSFSNASFSNTVTPYLYEGLCCLYNNGISAAERFGNPTKLKGNSPFNLAVADIDTEIVTQRRIKLKNAQNTEIDTDSNNLDIVYYKLNICEKEPEFCVFEKEPYFDTCMTDTDKKNRIAEIIQLQAMSIVGRLNALMRKNPSLNKIIIGMSGGLDSTAALLAAANAVDMLKLDRKNIIAVTMPGFGTSGRTYQNAKKLVDELKATFIEISIKESIIKHFSDISHSLEDISVVYENAQARERTQILLDLANKYNGIMLGTSDLSEIALGFSTFNGDHMGQFAVNACFTKTMLRHMTEHIAQSSENENIKLILEDILATPVSPELLPLDEDDNIAQLTENVLGPYILHEHFLYYFLKYNFGMEKLFYYAKRAFEREYTDEFIKKCLKQFIHRLYNNQFKRTCSPEGTNLATINMFPSDFMIPSDITSKEIFKFTE